MVVSHITLGHLAPELKSLLKVREFRTVGGYFRHDATTRHTRKRRSARGGWVRAASRVAALSRLFALQRGAEEGNPVSKPGVGSSFLSEKMNRHRAKKLGRGALDYLQSHP